MTRLGIVVASTRPGRAGLPIATWFRTHVERAGQFDVDFMDLAEIALPLLDEPKHPRLGQYEHEHTRRWSARVRAADAFVFVSPEYNYGSPPALLNALDYLFHEWAYKPAGFVSYGGMSGGMRSVQMTKLVLSTLKIVPLTEAVNIAMFSQHLGADGVFTGTEAHAKAADVMLGELARWAGALATLRS